MINSGNEILGSEMPSGNMNDGQMPSLDGEMPMGTMNDNPQNFSGEMPASGNEMPLGNMNDMQDNSSTQMSSSNSEMPIGNMGNGMQSTSVESQIDIHTHEEMPTGGMNDESAAIKAEKNNLKTIDIPGSWKLQLTHSS